jgi:hypothetical protein
MLSAILIISIPVIGLVSYLIGHTKGYKTADQFDEVSDASTPIYNQMALDYPEVFMWMKSERL